MKAWRRKLTGILLAALLLSGSLSPPVRSYYSLPTQQRILAGQQIDLNLDLPPYIADQIVKVSLNGSQEVKNSQIASEPGIFHVQLKLFGFLPLKDVTVQVLKPVDVVPGGHSIGILLHTRGVIVVGQAAVENKQGRKVYPAKEAGLQIGDTILAINGQQLNDDYLAANLIDAAGRQGRPVELLVEREGKKIKLTVMPEYCLDTGRYRLGVYIRDNTAGVGTLTFYEPREKVYGALGHVVSNWDGRGVMATSGGKVVMAYIQGVNQSQRGQPGEKIGVFTEDDGFVGDILLNTSYGIYGRLYTLPYPGPYAQPVPVALAGEVHPGPAEILTVINGQKIERFQVEIERVMPYQRASGKGLVLHITDSRLIRATGGIVQGMSGSPIIQDGKLVGAVTHVFLSDPTRGYGVFAEWMLIEMGLLEAPVTHFPGRFLVESPGFSFFGGDRLKVLPVFAIGRIILYRCRMLFSQIADG
ncbi:MAG: stage sporulation protein [Clostridia bacterium]|nr:stage sporulation protein [Clostridia bacterium]